MESANGKMTLNAKLQGIEDAVRQAERLNELLKEASTLIRELASFKLEVDVQF